MIQKISLNNDGIDRSDFLKIIAVLTMLIDHVGLFLFPNIIVLRLIGRISFPIFAYHIAVGFNNTSSINRYLKRLLIFALISQIPYSIAIGGFNIFFVLLLGLLVIKYYEEGNKEKLILIFIGVFILEGTLGFSYGLYGVFLPLFFHIYYDNIRSFTMVFIIMNIVYCFSRGQFYQIFSLFAIPIIYTQWKYKIQFNRYFYYSFYPVHIFILYLISKY